MEYTLLNAISSPEDLKRLEVSRLPRLCEELRDYMVHCCADNPGHLGSSLGAVEIIVAMHYVFDAPKDKLVFDVGHQAYAHKILTGRREAFLRNRKADGISGFPKMDESPYDAFGVGHASTSISAALGYSEAARIQGLDYKVVALIGDGAMTGGLAYEALNNAGASKSDLLVILNDNDQSIDKNTGGVHEYLLKLTTDNFYNRLKNKIWNRLGEGRLRSFLQKITLDAKSNLVRKSGGALFEALGLRYFGPVDGNDVVQMVWALRKLKQIGGPRLLHVHTVKGKGYKPAEEDPTTWHAPGRFDPESGKRKPGEHPADRYQDVFGEVLLQLARKDSRVVGITPAMASGCGMTRFAEAFPERFFDVGIEEEHAVTFSAGLACAGLRPFCNIYSSFSQRAYDQVIHDVALQNLPVVLCLDRAGLVGEDGATHNGNFDLAAFRSIPSLTIAAPADETELRRMMESALRDDCPYIIRYPRGCGEGTDWKAEEAGRYIARGRGEQVLKGSRLAVLALGPSVHRAVEAAKECTVELGFTPAVFNMRFLKPFDENLMDKACGFEALVTVEDGAVKGGLWSEVLEYLCRKGISRPVIPLGIPDRFIGQDSQASQRAECGLDAKGIGFALRQAAGKIFENILENKK